MLYDRAGFIFFIFNRLAVVPRLAAAKGTVGWVVSHLAGGRFKEIVVLLAANVDYQQVFLGAGDAGLNQFG